MTAADRQRLFEHLKDERRKGREAWYRLFNDDKPLHIKATIPPHGHAIRSTHPFRATNQNRLQRD